MHCYQALVCYSAMGHLRTTYPELIGTPGQRGSPPRSWWCPVVGMYRLEPNWWVQSGAGECKGSRPALPFHHTTVVLRCSYPAAVHRPSTEVYIYLGGHHWTWGYNHSSGVPGTLMASNIELEKLDKFDGDMDRSLPTGCLMSISFAKWWE